MSEIRLEIIKIKDLKPYALNSKIHDSTQVGQIRDSILQYGYNDPIAVDENNEIIEGHGRLEALKQINSNPEQEIKIPRIIGLTEKQKMKYRIAHNKINMNTGLDMVSLKAEFDNIGDLEFFKEIGFSSSELRLLNPTPEIAETVEVNSYERAKAKTQIKVGDIYQLGNHRLMCGDSTSKVQVELLMNGQKVDMVLSDPPYNVDYSEKNEFLNSISKGNRNQTPIKNDKIEDFRCFIKNYLEAVPTNNYNTIYLFTSGKEIANVILAFKEAGCYYSQDLKWIKNNHVLGRLDYNPKSENIIYGWKGKHKFYGGFQTDVIECDKPLRSEEHPTMKPIKLLAELLLHGSQEEMNVYDGFGGSGSTLIACEQTKRKCFMMELDPVYVQIIIDRYEKLTNQKAIKLN